MLCGRSVAGAGAALLLVLAGCGGDDPPADGSGSSGIPEDFCGDLIDAAIPRPGPGLADSWVAGGDVDGDDSATTATCTFNGSDHQIAVVVLLGDGADARYD